MIQKDADKNACIKADLSEVFHEIILNLSNIFIASKILYHDKAKMTTFCRKLSFLLVRAKGLEPPHLLIPEPKSGASANSATPANNFGIIPCFLSFVNYYFTFSVYNLKNKSIRIDEVLNMTVNFSELRTKEVINIEDGERLGFVSDITLDTMSGKISSISVPGAYKLLGLIGREDDKVIPWENIKKIGDDLIIVEGDKN